MQAGRAAIVFNAQPQLATLGVGQADDGLDQFAVREFFQVALELDGERFGQR